MEREPRSGLSIGLFCFLVLGLSALYGVAAPEGGIWGALRGYTPTLAALVTAGWVYGRRELALIRERVLRWRLPARLYLLALAGPLAACLLMVVATRWSGVPAAAAEPLRPGRLLLLFFVFAVVDGPIGEEIGWRGFFLPRLLERWGPLGASLVLGVVWYLWHLPLYRADGRALTLTFLAGYLVNNVSWSFIHTWFFLRSGQSALLAIVLHTAGNYFVFLGMTLAPELRTAPQARTIFLTLLAIAGLAAATALRRDPRPA